MSKRARRLGKTLLLHGVAFAVGNNNKAGSSAHTEKRRTRRETAMAGVEELTVVTVEVVEDQKEKRTERTEETIAKTKKRRKTEQTAEDCEAALAADEDLTASGDSSDSLGSDIDEELDEKLREEVEKDIPSSISDLSLAEKTVVKRVLIIWNPYAGNRRGKKVMTKAKKLLEREGIIVDTIKLERRGHAEEICENHDMDGTSTKGDDESGDRDQVDVLAAVGGDGTFHECVNGMMKRIQAKKRPVPLAMLAAGTGNSFLRELQVKTLSNAVYHIARGVHYPIDICKVSFGDGSTCYAFNSLHWGLGSKVNVRAEKLRWMGSAIRYTTAALFELIKGGTTRAKITVVDKNDEEKEFDDDFCLVIANNIITAAKGMKMAPEAKLDDGLIDMLLIRTDSSFDLMQIFRKTYDGTHTELSYVDYLQVKRFSIAPYEVVRSEGVSEEVQIEEIVDIDGELKGVTPFSCEVLQRALRVIL